MTKEELVNVFGEPLTPCIENPVTDLFHDIYCNTTQQDAGLYTLCIEVSEDFLEFTRLSGNDLSRPVPEFEFTGLKAGDRWCMSAWHWLEAYEQGMAPRILLARTPKQASEIIPLRVLKKYAIDLI